MLLLSNMIDQPIQRNRKRTRSRPRARYVGISLMFSAVVMAAITAIPGFFLSSWILGLVGVYAYSLFVLKFFVGLAIHRRKKYKVSKKYAILSSIMLFSLFCALHVAFTRYALDTLNYGNYLTHGFRNTTPGGMLFAIPSFIFHAVFFFEGALVVLGVVFIVSLAFVTSLVISDYGQNKVIKRVPVTTPVFESEPDFVPEVMDKELNARLEEKYQEMFIKQGRVSHERAKSELGLTAPLPMPKSDGTYDQPIPLVDLQPMPDQINELSTAAATQFLSGTEHVKDVDTRLKSPIYVPLGNVAKKPTPQSTEQNFVQPEPVMPAPFPMQNAHDALFQQPPAPPWNVSPPPASPPMPAWTPPASPMPNPFMSAPPQPQPDLVDVEAEPIIVPRGGVGLQTRMDAVPPVAKKPYRRPHYKKPSIDLITSQSFDPTEYQQEALQKRELLNTKLRQLGVKAAATNYTVAPAVTQFELQLSPETRVSQITQLENDIGLALGSPQVRLVHAIKGKNAMGIEVPNEKIGMVSIKDLLKSKEFMQHKSPIAVAIGKNINDEIVVGDIASMPHLLVAGSTGAGKSVMLNTILTSLLFRAHPDDVKLLLVDMKKVELSMYNRIPHMLIPETLKEVNHVLNALKWISQEMQNRYDLLEEHGVLNIKHYHALPGYVDGTLPRMPYLLMIIDEAAELLQRGKKEVEELLKSLAALARASGVHLILATQRPSAEIITGDIKINFPCRIAFKVGTRHDSATILDSPGAEKLVGRGDMIFSKEGQKERVQSCYIDADECKAIMNYIRSNNPADFDSEVEDMIKNGLPVQGGGDGKGFTGVDQDPLFEEAARYIVREDNYPNPTISISQLQRKFGVGFSRAGKIMDQLDGAGFLGPQKGSKAREVIVAREQITGLYGE